MSKEDITQQLNALHLRLLDIVPAQKTSPVIAVRTKANSYAIAKPGMDTTPLASEAVSEKQIPGQGDVFACIFSKKSDANAILIVGSEYALKAADSLKILPASLDDMAQIVGITARIADSMGYDTVLRCLKKRNACLVRGEGMLVTGRTQKEALTTALLLEKACFTHILAQKLGGIKRVPFLSAHRMHNIYQQKYSVIDLTEDAKREESL